MAVKKVIEAMLSAVKSGDCASAGLLLVQHPSLAHTRLELENGSTWLHEAASGKSIKMVQLLLDNDIPVDTLDKDHDTPLSVAALYCNGDLSVVQMLLKHGASPDGHPRQFNSPLHWCATNKDESLAIDILLKHGANIEIRNYENQTPLMRAALEGNLFALKKFVKAGANINAIGGKDSNQSALDFARKKDRPAVIEFLEAYEKSLLASQAIDEVIKLPNNDRIRPL